MKRCIFMVAARWWRCAKGAINIVIETDRLFHRSGFYSDLGGPRAMVV